MTIDEAISKYRNRVEQYKDWDNLKDIAEEHEQLAEWLEELKIYKECNISKTNFSKGYTKAIDDFAEQYKKSNVVPQVYERIFRMVQLGEDDFGSVAMDIDKLYCDLADKVAEQLKAGGVE